MRKINILVILLILSVFACQKKSDIIAKVGSQTLTAEEFLEELNKVPDSYVEFIQTDAGKKQFLHVLLKEKIMMAAAQDLKIDESADYKKAFNDYEVELKKQLNDYKRNLLVELYYQKLKNEDIAVSSQEVQSFYEQNQEKYKNPLKFTFSHIILPDKKKADDVYSRLKNGDSFTNLSAEFSSESWVNTESGKLEYTQPDSLSPEIESVAVALKLGEISAPVQSQNGYFILRKDSEVSIKPISLEEAKSLIESLLEKQKFDELMGKLENKYNIQVKWNVVDKYVNKGAIEKAAAKGK